MNPFLDAIGDVGYALDTPGAYLRGLLAGRPGQRQTGDELLDAYGMGGVPGAGVLAGMATDPLMWLGAGGAAWGAGKLGRVLGEHPNPLLRGMGELAGGEAGAVDPRAISSLLTDLDSPLGRFKALADEAGIHMPGEDLGAMVAKHLEGYPRRVQYSRQDPFAIMTTDPRLPGKPIVIPNLNFDEWGSTPQMDEAVKMLLHGHHPEFPRHGDYIGVHEIGHGLHYNNILKSSGLGHLSPEEFTSRIPWGFALGDSEDVLNKQIRERLGAYATYDPAEFVAEGFADKVLNQQNLPPHLESLYRNMLGPPARKWSDRFGDILEGGWL